MDACIARGGISHVLLQARASLKTPSRPFTPQISGRSLFHGHEYRSESHMSSSNTVQERNEMLPLSEPKPRPNERKPQSCQPTPKLLFSGRKLVHAPILSDDDSDDEAAIPATTGMHVDVEASLSLPSNDALQLANDEIERYLDNVLGLTDSPEFASAIERLRDLVDNFVRLSVFLQTSHQSLKDHAPAELKAQLFNKLCSVILDQWETNAICLLELAPSLLGLYGVTTGGSDDVDVANSASIVTLGKTLFALSKDSKNDDCFCNVRYVEAILHAISSTSDALTGKWDDKNSIDTEDAITILAGQPKFPMMALIYATATIKNISNAEGKMVHLLATNRAIAILSKTLLWRAEDAAQSKEVAQILVQTTGILRNLSVLKTNHKQFVEGHIPRRLCRMIPAFITHPELTVNISRILSKLTLHEHPRAQINQHSKNVQNLVTLIDPRYNSWISLMNQQLPKTRFQDLLFVRVFFILGNMCASNDQNRRLIGTNNGILTILDALHFYAKGYLNAHIPETIEERNERRCAAEAEQAIEVLVKLIRVLANLAINADVGTELNGHNTLEPLLNILKISQRAGHEELMLNTVSCITNVSYYTTTLVGESNHTQGSLQYDFIKSNRITITQLLSRILLNRNVEAVVEAARAFGNLSRFQDVLQYMDKVKVLECFVVLLDHSNREVVYTVCGVLMNAALDHYTREILLCVRPRDNSNCVDIRSLLVGIIECARSDDMEMTLIASKALYNLLLPLQNKPASSNNDGSLAFEAGSLRQIIENVLESNSTTQVANKEIKRRESESNANEEHSDLGHEFRLVLSKLLESFDGAIDSSRLSQAA